MATRESGFTPAAAADRTPPAFDTVRRGFDPDQVIGYLKRVAERVQDLESRVQEAEKERDEARRDRDVSLQTWGTATKDPYESMSAHVADLVRSLDADVDKLRREARDEADHILAQAQSEAERALLGAQGAEAEARAQAEHIVRRAREEAEQVSADLAAIHGSSLNDLRIIRDRMLSAAKDLEVVLGDDRSEERVVVIDEADEGAPPSEMTSAETLWTQSDYGV